MFKICLKLATQLAFVAMGHSIACAAYTGETTQAQQAQTVLTQPATQTQSTSGYYSMIKQKQAQNSLNQTNRRSLNQMRQVDGGSSSYYQNQQDGKFYTNQPYEKQLMQNSEANANKSSNNQKYYYLGYMHSIYTNITSSPYDGASISTPLIGRTFGLSGAYGKNINSQDFATEFGFDILYNTIHTDGSSGRASQNRSVTSFSPNAKLVYKPSAALISISGHKLRPYIAPEIGLSYIRYSDSFSQDTGKQQQSTTKIVLSYGIGAGVIVSLKSKHNVNAVVGLRYIKFSDFKNDGPNYNLSQTQQPSQTISYSTTALTAGLQFKL